MNFGAATPFGVAATAAAPAGTAPAQSQQVTGPAIEEIQTKEIGFQAIAGDAKVRLIPDPWPADDPPASGSSLLAIAPTKSLLVAVGPRGLVVCSTDALREAFTASNDSNSDSSYKPFKAQLEVPIAQKVSHIAFTRDDVSLVAVTQDDHGIIAFETDAFLRNNPQPVFNVPTPNIRFRHFVANPGISRYFAAITYNGELMVIDMSQKSFVQSSGGGGSSHAVNCSCVAWSKKGKQLVAGTMDGSMVQMTPEGQVKAEIPRPSDLEGDRHVSSIAWLENDVFLAVYSTADASSDFGVPAESYYFIYREKGTSNYTFRSAPEVALAVSPGRLPPKQFITRLMNYEPHLSDCLIVLSTSSTDVGLYTRASKPLAPEHADPASITNEFTATTMSDDSRRAGIPMTESMEDTTPVGVSLDLSTEEPVLSPIPGEDFPDSGVPLPGLAVLNTEGVLSYWYIVYSDAIREKKPYTGGAAAVSTTTSIAPTPAPAQAAAQAAPAQPAFGQSAFGASTSTPFGQSTTSTAAPAFGKPAGGPPAFGQSGFGQPAFGQSGFGTPAKPAAAPAFGTPSFGTPSAPGTASPAAASTSAFGQPSSLGASFGSSSFGKPSGLGASTGGSGGGGFSSFAGTGGGGFGAFASAAPASPFLQQQSKDKPAEKATPSSPFASVGSTTAAAPANPFRQSGGFGTGSTFGGGASSTLSGASAPTPATPATPFGAPAAAATDAANPFASLRKPSFGVGSPLRQVTSAADTQSAEADIDGVLSGISSLGGDSSKAAPVANPFGPQGAAASTTAAEPPVNPFTAAATKASAEAGSPTKADPVTATEEAPAVTKVEAAPLPPDPVFGAKPTAPAASSAAAAAAPLPAVPADDAGAKPQQQEEEEKTKKKAVVPEAAPLPPDPFPTKSTQRDVKKDEKSKDAAEVSTASQPPLFASLNKAKLAESAGEYGTRSPVDFAPAPLPTDFTFSSKGDDGAAVALPSDESDAESEVSEEEEELGEEDDDEAVELTDEASDVSEEEEEEEDEVEGHEREVEETAQQEAQATTTRAVKATPVKPTSTTTTSTFKLGGPLAPPRSPSPPAARAKARPNAQPLRQSASRTKRSPQKTGLTPSRLRSITAEDIADRDDLELVLEPPPEEARAADTAAPDPEPEPEPEELDEHEFVLQRLAAPLEPCPVLDPPVSRQDYGGRIHKLAMHRKIEVLYRDVTAMIDTVGLNARSLSAYVKYQHVEAKDDTADWLRRLQSDEDRDVLHEELLLTDAGKMQAGVAALSAQLGASQRTRLRGLEAEIQALLSRVLVRLRGQCLALRRTLDAHADAAAISAAPLTPEQSSVQASLRAATRALNDRLAALERGVAALRARLADAAAAGGGGGTAARRPTARAVAATLQAMAGMVQEKSGAVDELELQMRALGLARGGAGAADHMPPNASVAGHDNTLRGHGHGHGGEAAAQLGSSVVARVRKAGYAGSVAGVLSTVPDEEVRRLKSAAASRRRAARLLREAVVARGEVEVRALR